MDDVLTKSRKLNVGCGFDKRPGYVNIDLQSFHEPDIVGDALDLHMIPSNWAEEIIVFDVIEHFGRKRTSEALLEWNRVLQMGGAIRLRTTYLPGLLKRMEYDWFGSLATHKELILNLFSSQAYEGDYHFTAFTEKLLRFFMWSCGFHIVELTVQDNWLFTVIASKIVDYSYEALLASSLPEEAFVAGLYRDILCREPDADGLSGKLSLLEKGIASRREIVRGFLASEEREDLMAMRAPEFELQFDAK